MCSFQSNLFGFILVTNVDMIYSNSYHYRYTMFKYIFMCVVSALLLNCVIQCSYFSEKHSHRKLFFLCVCLQNLTTCYSWEKRTANRSENMRKLWSKIWLAWDLRTQTMMIECVWFAKHILLYWIPQLNDTQTQTQIQMIIYWSLELGWERW